VIEARFAEGHFDRLAGLASDLVRLKVDVMVTMVTAASLAAKSVAGKTPIVMVGVADPVGSRLATSLARPGGNVTGTSSVASEVVGKQLEALRAAVPGLSRVSILWNPENRIFQAQQAKEAEGSVDPTFASHSRRSRGLQSSTVWRRSLEHESSLTRVG
jgi:putative tryptophan/tyrosine transport system substrate-binding protein